MIPPGRRTRTPREVSELYPISEWTVRKLCRQGRIKAINRGTAIQPRWMIPDEALEQFERENANTSA